MLRAACDTAVERFDEDDIDDLSISHRILELRDILDGYLAEAARHIGMSSGQPA